MFSWLKRIPARATKAGSFVFRRCANLNECRRGIYRPFRNNCGLSLERTGIPPATFCADGTSVILGPDFLPDRFSLSGDRFEDSPHLTFAHKYLQEDGSSYTATEYYDLAVRGRLPYPCRGHSQARSRCKRYIYLIERLKAEGYRPESRGYITVVECIDGRVMVLNGKHRLGALIALGVREFPVVFCFENEVRAIFVDRIRSSWPPWFYQKSLKTLDLIGQPPSDQTGDMGQVIADLRAAKLETLAEVYHPIPFPPFRDLTTQVTNGTPYHRLGMILQKCCSFRGRAVLDLGCNVGFYSFSLAKRGAHVTGIDVRQEYINIASTLARKYELPAHFSCTSIDPGFFDQPRRYDVTLCFSMIQWVVKQNGHACARTVLKLISECSASMFFDVSVNTGKACLTCEPGRELPFVHSLLQEATTYEHIEFLGDVHPYGTDTRHVFFLHHGQHGS